MKQCVILSQDGALEKDLLGTEVALSDAMRFKGAGPEIINGRLSSEYNVIVIAYSVPLHNW